ncbi:MAG: hypothetical protein RLZZ630_1768 [Bacteroidota bacterium]
MATPFKIRTSVQALIFLLAFISMQDSYGTTFYSKQNGSWNDTLTWSTVGHTGANTNSLPGVSDTVFVGDGHSVELNASCTASILTVGGGTSGILFFNGSTPATLQVSNKLTVRLGAALLYDSNSAIVHELRIEGDLINSGTIDLVKDVDDHVRLTFMGAKHSVVTESAGLPAPLWYLNEVNVEKTVQKTFRVDSRAPKFEDAIGLLNVVYGTYMHNNKGTFNVNARVGYLTVGPDAIFHVNQGVMHLAQASDRLILQGKLLVTRGTMRVGNSAGRVGLLYEQSGTVTPEISITSGSLVVNGGLRPSVGHDFDPILFSQTGGNTRLNTGTVGTSAATFKISESTSSSFTFDGGLLTIEKANNSAGVHPDFDLGMGVAAVSCTDGRVAFGNANTPSGTVFTFVPVNGLIFPHFIVSGSTSGTSRLCPSVDNTSDIILSSLKIESGKTFDIRSVSGTPADSRVVTLVQSFDNVHALFNDGTFQTRTGKVVFESTEGLGVGGSATTCFHNLTINNPDGVVLWQRAEVSDSLVFIDGKLFTTQTSPIIVFNNARISGASSSRYVDGPVHCWITANAQQRIIEIPVGKDNAYRPIQMTLVHNTSDSVLYKTEVMNQSARAMNFTLPVSLTHVSSVRYYLIERGPVNNLSSASAVFTYGQDDDVTDYRGLRMANDDGASTWIDLGGTATSNGTGSIFVPLTSFNSIFTLANAVGFSNPLPVELLSFTAKIQKEVVVLDWATASEMNSDFFEVQRSTDGLNYTELGRVTAAGNSNVLVRYSFNDNQPVRGVNYYRLRQVDIDGTETFSPIRSVNYIPGKVTVFPNPVADRVVNVNMPESEEVVTISLLRADGSTVTEPVQTSFLAGSMEFRLSDAIHPGCYLLRMQSAAGQVWQERLVVVK